MPIRTHTKSCESKNCHHCHIEQKSILLVTFIIFLISLLHVFCITDSIMVVTIPIEKIDFLTETAEESCCYLVSYKKYWVSFCLLRNSQLNHFIFSIRSYITAEELCCYLVSYKKHWGFFRL